MDSFYICSGAGRLTALETVKAGQTIESYTIGYDPAGNLASLYDQSYGTSTYSYDELNRLTAENLAGYGAISYSYDAAGNRTTLTTPQPAGGPGLALSMRRIYWASYQDWLDHQLSIDYRITDNGPGTAFGSKVTNSTATSGVYLTTTMPMNLGEISEGSFADFTLKYYIPSGVTSFQATVYSTCADSGGTDYYYPEKKDFYSYNQANQLTEVVDHDGETTAFSYNASGAITRKTTGSETTTYSYDGMDRLSQVQTPASTVDYAYDALGRRIQRSEGTGTTNYHLSGKTDLTDYQTDETGTLTAASLRGAGGLISATDYTLPAPETGYYLFNPHGDTSAIADEAGTVTVADDAIMTH
jgi:YD repeat-containing protein